MTGLTSGGVLRSISCALFVFSIVFSAGTRIASAQAFSEGFDTVIDNDPMPLPNWVAINRSQFVGATMWFQGNPEVFPSYTGAPDSYIGANFNATTGDSTISLWLLTPVRTFNNGDVVKFYTQTVPGSIYPDRLQLRFSSHGASTDVGTTPTSVGDFSTLMLDINPTLAMGGYPEYWTLESATISGLTGPTSGRIAFRYFVTNGGPTGANSNFIGIDAFSITHPAAHQESDYDGDGITDLSVLRNTGPNGQITWFNQLSSTGELYAAPWGIASPVSDFAAPGDYDGDNKTDIAVWRQGAAGVAAYYVLRTSNATMITYQFGQTGDNPDVHADFDGDGKTDPAVYRGATVAGGQSYFFYRGSLNNPAGNITYVPWGTMGDFPFTGDFDGNGRADFAVQRNNGSGSARFYRLYSNGTMDSVVFGNITDTIVPGDYDGDGKTDIAVIRAVSGAINWYVLPSSTGTISATPYAIFGDAAADYVCQGDYDGDGRTDPAVFRQNADPDMNFFYWNGSLAGFQAAEWGQNNDYPAANWNTH